MEELLPVLVAWVDDGAPLVLTLRAALGNEVCYLALEQPPFEQTTHILEVHVPGGVQPFVLLAEPVGFAKGGMFPLQVRPLDDVQRTRIEQAAAFGDAPERAEARLSSLPPPPSRKQLEAATTSTRPAPDPLVGRALGGGKFRIDHLLGSGAAGRVYRALHRDLQKTVAVKVLHPFYQSDAGYVSRFQGEALAASRIDHPNVLRILDFGQEADGMLYIVMEFLEGRDLHDVIEKEGPIPTDRLLAIAMQVCAGLSVAHDAGIIHRDIKPENVFLVPGLDDEGNPTEIAKVCDFGIAQTRSTNEEGERMICGTPEYMSLEQWQAEDLDARTDIYALGVTLYEMATRFVPVTGESTTELYMRLVQDEIPPPSLYNAEIDPRLDAIIAKCIAKKRDDRFASVRELRAALRALVEFDKALARRNRRREILEAADLTPLEDAASGFTEFFLSVSTAIMRTGYYDKNHREASTALARLAAATDQVLRNRGELSFSRRDVGESVAFSIVTAAGEVRELKKVLPLSVYELYAEKFGDVFVRRNIISLAFRDGVDEEELADVVELLSGPEIPAEELRAKFLTRAFTGVSVLFVADLLGRKRKLPWQVDLCISRVARDLSTIPLSRGMNEGERRALRAQMIGDVLRVLGRPEQLRILLDNADLIADESNENEAMGMSEVIDVVANALSQRAAIALATLLVDELDGIKRPGAAPSTEPQRVDTAQLLTPIVLRFTRERAEESDALLRTLYEKSIVQFRDLPRDLQLWITAEHRAANVTKDPEGALGPLDAAADADAYEREVLVLEYTLRVLAQRSDVEGMGHVVDRFQAHARDDRRPARARQRVVAALQIVEEPQVLMCIAHTLLGGAAQVRRPAQRLLSMVGAKAAHPLSEARQQLPGTDASLRARFVSALRETGPDGLEVIGDALGRLGMGGDATLIEDFLRAVPDVANEVCGQIVEPFIEHPSPMVRRAAATALASLAGPKARGALLQLFSGSDDGVRLGALAGLRRIKAIDNDVVARVDRIMSGMAPAGEELRAASAAALADCVPDQRGTAMGILARAVKLQRKSFVGLLKDALAAPPESTMVLLASARALVTIGGDRGREAVRERAALATGTLKQQLESLL